MKQHLSALLLLFLALGAGCGDDAPPKEPDAPPLSTNDAVTTPQELLAALHRRLTTGEGLYTQDWQDDVRRVAEALWPEDAAGTVPEAGRIHFQLAGIAGSTARYVLKDDEAGRAYLADNPEDKLLHDLFLEAVVTGEAGYRTWCETKGAEVLATWKRTRRERVLGR